MLKDKEKDYIRLGKILEKLLIKDYIDLIHNWKRLLFLSFMRGIAAGFGGVLGATVLVGILLWLLNMFDQLPWVGRLFETVKEAIRG